MGKRRRAAKAAIAKEAEKQKLRIASRILAEAFPDASTSEIVAAVEDEVLRGAAHVHVRGQAAKPPSAVSNENDQKETNTANLAAVQRYIERLEREAKQSARVQASQELKTTGRRETVRVTLL